MQQRQHHASANVSKCSDGQGANDIMKKWGNRIRIQSKLITKSSQHVGKASRLPFEENHFSDKPVNRRIRNESSERLQYAQLTGPESSQVPRALFSLLTEANKQTDAQLLDLPPDLWKEKQTICQSNGTDNKNARIHVQWPKSSWKMC